MAETSCLITDLQMPGLSGLDLQGRLMLARTMKGSAHAKEAAAFRELSMLVGAIVIARASDPKTARDVLAACKATA